MSEQKKKQYSKIKEFLNSPEQKAKMEKNLDMVMNLIPSGTAKAVSAAAAKGAETVAAKIASPLKERAKQAFDVFKGKSPDIVEQSGKKAIQSMETQKFAGNVPTGRVADKVEMIFEKLRQDPSKKETLSPKLKENLEKLMLERIKKESPK